MAVRVLSHVQHQEVRHGGHPPGRGGHGLPEVAVNLRQGLVELVSPGRPVEALGNGNASVEEDSSLVEDGEALLCGAQAEIVLEGTNDGHLAGDPVVLGDGVGEGERLRLGVGEDGAGAPIL